MDYSDIMDKNRPEHIDDVFSRRHPKMQTGDRAKIFAPFAALKTHVPTVKKRENQTEENAGLPPDDDFWSSGV